MDKKGKPKGKKLYTTDIKTLYKCIHCIFNFTVSQFYSSLFRIPKILCDNDVRALCSVQLQITMFVEAVYIYSNIDKANAVMYNVRNYINIYSSIYNKTVLLLALF